ncbi:MAG: HEAT repeat domain-containing protein, partial [Candidatus Hodarchaeota archaeon]
QPVLDTIFPLINDKFPDIRATVAKIIGLISTFRPEYEATDKLVSMLEDSNGFVRLGAALGLGLVASSAKDASRILFLITPLLKDDFGDGRRGAALSLGFLASSGRNNRLEQVLPLLTPLMKDKDGYVRRAVAIALGLIGASLDNSDQILDLLRPLTIDRNKYAQSAASLSLGLISHRLSSVAERDALGLTLISNSEDYVRRGGALGVGILTRKETIERSWEYLDDLLVDSPSWVKTNAAMAMGQIIALIYKDSPEDARERLKPLFESPTAAIRLGSIIGFVIGYLDLSSIGSGWEMLITLDSFSHGWYELGSVFLAIGLLRYLNLAEKPKLVTTLDETPKPMTTTASQESESSSIPVPLSSSSSKVVPSTDSQSIATAQSTPELVLEEIFDEWTLDRTYHELFCDTWKKVKIEINLALRASKALNIAEKTIKDAKFALVDKSSSQGGDIVVAIVKGATRLKTGAKKGLVTKITTIVQEKKSACTIRLELAGDYETEFLSQVLLEISRRIKEESMQD